ncbi:hypothetical protein [Nocardia sp. NPDC023988]|uniref:hypothetical protein n=1 Tax=unclassified Nocardia TaxID=2637762 RepID=UPI0033DB690C
MFDAVQLRLASRGPRSTGRATQRRKHPYAFKGLISHKSCGRLMQGTWNHDKAHYRCRYPSEYAIANQIDHQLSVYIREDKLTGQLDHWLAQIFRSEQVEESLVTLESAQADQAPQLEEARRLISNCDRKLARYRDALDAGADPVTVAGWTRQTQAERQVAASQLASLKRTVGEKPRLSREGIRELVESLGGMVSALGRADPEDKNAVYRQIGLKLTYIDKTRVVIAEATPPVGVLVVSGGRFDHYAHRLIQHTSLVVD